LILIQKALRGFEDAGLDFFDLGHSEPAPVEEGGRKFNPLAPPQAGQGILGEVHQVRLDEPTLYHRRLRELEGRLTTDTGAAYDRVVFTEGPRTFVNIPLLLKQTPLVQDEIILTLFRAQDIEPLAEKVAHVLNLCLMQTGRSLSLSGRVKVSRDRDRLVFLSSVPDESFAYAVEVGKSYRFPGFEFTAQVERSVPEEFNRDRMTEFVDAAQLGNSLVVRNWKEGDWFIPLGLGTKRKLSDFFVDNKIPRFEKNRIPLLESDGRVVWVCGHRIDDRFKITAKTATVVKIQYVQHPNG